MPSSRCHNTGLLRGLPVRSLSLLSLALLSLALMACGDGPTVVREVDTLVRTVDVQGSSRSYWLYVSASAAASPSTPLLLVFHGATQTASGAALMSWLYPLADAEGLIVADPQATGDYWNTPNSLPRYWDVPDVPFVDEVINDIDREFGVDRSRLYVAGFSNGTIFTEGLACTRGDRFAAVAMVGASMSLEISQNCPSSQPIPAMFFFATQIRSFLVGWIRRRIGHAGRGGQCPVVGHEQRMPTSADHDRSAAPGRRWHVRRAVGLCRVRSR